MERYEKFKEYKKAMWLVIVALFFLIGFLRMHGASYGLSFLVGAAVEQLVKVILLQDGDYEQPGTHREERRSTYLSTLMAGSRDLIFRAELHDGRVVYHMGHFPDRRSGASGCEGQYSVKCRRNFRQRRKHE